MTVVDSNTFLHPENTYLFFALTPYPDFPLIKLRVNAVSESEARARFPHYHLIFAGCLPDLTEPDCQTQCVAEVQP